MTRHVLKLVTTSNRKEKANVSGQPQLADIENISNRGDYAVIFLETRKQQIKAKYRSTEIVTGVPVTTRSPFPKKKVNPAITRKYKLRLENFLKVKSRESHMTQHTCTLAHSTLTPNTDNTLFYHSYSEFS